MVEAGQEKRQTGKESQNPALSILIFLDGTRLRFPYEYPFRIRHRLSFPQPLFHEGNIIGHAGGRGPMSLLKCYGVMDRSIKKGPVFQFEIGCRYTVVAVDRLAMRSLICDRLSASISAGALPNSTHRQVQE